MGQFSHFSTHQYDYTKGQLPELTDVIIEKKAALFVCAIGVPPKEMVDKLHAAGIVVMKYARNKIQTHRAAAFFSNIW